MGWYDQTQVVAPREINPAQSQEAAMQSIGLLQKFLGDVGNLMKESRIEAGRNAANKAISELMAKKPSKEVDPTQHIGQVSQLLGFASPEMRESVKQYTSALDTNYGRELQNQQFEKGQALQKLLAQEQMANAIEAAKIAAAAQYAGIEVQREQLEMQKKIKDFEMAKVKAQLDSEGYTVDNNTGAIKYDSTSPNAVLSRDASFRDSYSKKPMTADEFLNVAEMNDAMHGWATLDKTYLNAYNKANQLLLTPTTDPSMLELKGKVKALLYAGDYEGINSLIK